MSCVQFSACRAPTMVTAAPSHAVFDAKMLLLSSTIMSVLLCGLVEICNGLCRIGGVGRFRVGEHLVERRLIFRPEGCAHAVLCVLGDLDGLGRLRQRGEDGLQECEIIHQFFSGMSG